MGETYPNVGTKKLGSRWCVYALVATSLMCALRDHVDPGVGFAHSCVEEWVNPRHRVPLNQKLPVDNLTVVRPIAGMRTNEYQVFNR